MCASLWRWHKGEHTAGAEAGVDVAALGAAVAALACAGDEALRMGAAYALGSCGHDSPPAGEVASTRPCVFSIENHEGIYREVHK